MPLILKPAKRAAHAEHVVRRLRAEDHDAFRKRLRALRPPRVVGLRLAARPAGDGVLEFVEDADVHPVGRPLLGQEIGHAVLAIVFIEELEDGFSDLLREPDDRAAHERRRPLHGADEPRMPRARQRRGRRAIDEETRPRMALQEARGQRFRRRALDRLRDHAGLRLAPREERDAARVEDRADAHRDRVPRHVGFAEKITRRVAPGQRVERDEPRARIPAGARLVEADVPRAADAENLQVEPARGADLLLEGLAPGENIGARHGTVGHVYVFRQYINMIEQLLVHEPPVTLGMRAREAVIFIEVERDDAAEAEPVLPVEPDQPAIEPHRRRAGREPEHGVAAGGVVFADQRLDLRGQHGAGLVGAGVYISRDALALARFDAVGNGHGGNVRGDSTSGKNPGSAPARPRASRSDESRRRAACRPRRANAARRPRAPARIQWPRTSPPAR